MDRITRIASRIALVALPVALFLATAAPRMRFS